MLTVQNYCYTTDHHILRKSSSDFAVVCDPRAILDDEPTENLVIANSTHAFAIPLISENSLIAALSEAILNVMSADVSFSCDGVGRFLGEDAGWRDSRRSFARSRTNMKPAAGRRRQ